MSTFSCPHIDVLPFLRCCTPQVKCHHNPAKNDDLKIDIDSLPSQMTENYNFTEDNVNDNNINESNTNAEVSSMVMVGLGGRSLERSRRSADLLKQG